MEVQELSPPARSRCSLTATQGASEEDDGFVDILESDLKVTSFAPLGHRPPFPWDLPKEESPDLPPRDYDFIPMSEEESVLTESS